MKKLFIGLLISILVAQETFALSCCVGGNPKSFLSLQRLQNYEIGIASSFRDVYGIYGADGDLYPFMTNQTLSIAVGAAMRIGESLQLFTTIPFVHRYLHAGRDAHSANTLGDILVGAQYTLVENLFRDDWYPTIHLTAGVKGPSGTINRRVAAGEVPGTGNGLWEPNVGIVLEKGLGIFNFGLRAGYNWRLARGAFAEGDTIELSQSISTGIGRQLNIAVGSTQTFYLDQSRSGRRLVDSGGRLVTAFVSPTYFIDRFWSVGVGAEFSVPSSGFGRNQPATQAVTITTKYAFY